MEEPVAEQEHLVWGCPFGRLESHHDLAPEIPADESAWTVAAALKRRKVYCSGWHT